MLPSTRAVIFDLDDTLYPLRHFTFSGFSAVAGYLERTCDADRDDAFRILMAAYRSPARGCELQACQRYFGLPADIVPVLVDLMRAHEPRLWLPRTSRRTLLRLRDRWRVGVVTNGSADVQHRKVRAL